MKTYIKIAGYITLALLALLGAALLVIIEPHIEYSLVRQSQKPETIEAIWVAWACGGNDRITEIVDGTIADNPFSIAVPDNGLNPEDSEAAYSGNTFILSAYRYYRKRKNKLTGDIQLLPSLRLDVVKWSVELPYNKLLENGEVIQVDTPLEWEDTRENHSAANFKFVRNSSC
ncbi:hypothetical protein [Kaarinaea lacus]